MCAHVNYVYSWISLIFALNTPSWSTRDKLDCLSLFPPDKEKEVPDLNRGDIFEPQTSHLVTTLPELPYGSLPWGSWQAPEHRSASSKHQLFHVQFTLICAL